MEPPVSVTPLLVVSNVPVIRFPVLVDADPARVVVTDTDVWVWFVPREDRIRVANVLQFSGLLTAPAGFENERIG